MFETATAVRIIMVVIGFGLCVTDFISYSKQKLTERFAFWWGIFSVVILLSGAVPALSGWTRVFDFSTYAGVILLFLAALAILYSMSLTISELTRKNQELAMQVSLLNNENEQMLGSLRHLQEKAGSEEKGFEDKTAWRKGKRRYS